jgi:hypothetical protein
LIVEPELSEPAVLFVESLAQNERDALCGALTALCQDPRPDGCNKVELPFPYKPGTLGFAYGKYSVAYRLDGNRVWIIAICVRRTLQDLST